MKNQQIKTCKRQALRQVFDDYHNIENEANSFVIPFIIPVKLPRKLNEPVAK